MPSNESSISGSFYRANVGFHKFYVDKRYQELIQIGDGSYGYVAAATDTVTGRRVAIKKIKDTFLDIVDAKRILREIKLLRHFQSHENVIRIQDIMTNPPNTAEFDDIYIVTTLFESDLEKIIRSKQQLTDRHFQFFLYQLLRALKFLHTANVLHRDLKPSNILVNANCDLAVCDFGLARGYNVQANDELTAYVVTRWYRAPEILCNTSSYGKAADIWSVGCIFAELLTHKPFFMGDNPQHQLEEVIKKIGCPSDLNRLSFIDSQGAVAQLQYIISKQSNKRLPPFSSYFPSGCSTLALDLLEKLLQFVPNERLTVEQALAHPYLRDFHLQMPEPACDTVFDFSFEKFIDEQGVNGKEAIRFMMYEEMRIYRPSIPDFPAPWMKNYRDIIHPISFENKAMDVDDALYNQGSTPICGSGSAAFFGGLEHNFDSKQESESDDKFYDAQAFVSSKDSK